VYDPLGGLMGKMSLLAQAKRYKKERRFNLALSELKKALELESENKADIHLELAWIYHDIGDNDSAIKELDRVIELGRDESEVRLGLAKLYRERGNYKQALGQLEFAMQNFPGDGRIFYELGWLKREMGNYESSANEFLKALGAKPYNEDPFFENMVFNEIEISKRKTVLMSKPMVLGVTLTHRCNIKCTMCELRRRPWDIPTRTAKEILRSLPYLRYVYWQGGEPFLSDHFADLFDAASCYPNLNQTIVTNGTLIKIKWAEKLVSSNNVDIIFSIDGTTKETYERIRDGARFEDLIESIDIVNEHKKRHLRDNPNQPLGLTTTMQVVIMRSNYHELERFVEFAKENKFDCLNLIPIRYTDGGENIFLDKDPKALRYIQETMPILLRKSQEYGIKLFNQLPGFEDIRQAPGPQGYGSSDMATDEASGCPKRKMLCYWPWKSLYILRDGMVKPYGFCEEHVGDVNRHPLLQIWNSPEMRMYRRRMLNCDYLDFCSLRCTSGIMPPHSLKLE
jgi:MoaA/NifB/PqqE/SkfB family radical SAM enzyme